MAEELFWADQIAKRIADRKKFHYVDKTIPRFNNFVVKTSASISGVLHIGRLSDTVRGATVARALMDAGKKVDFIWVAEDMDPLRSIPSGVPASYEKYAGMAVTDIPDPAGCHKSYAEHHAEKYFDVLDRFVFLPMRKYSMRAEYKKGSFKPYIKMILEHLDENLEIQNKYRDAPLKRGWSPWTPVCANCGKIATPRVSSFENGLIHYHCEDYQFEKVLAKGCSFKGSADPLKDDGKLMWKSEWASQWAFWKVCSEGAGKEYQVPSSAFWINGEICERIFGFPMPEPIFYEHLMIDGVKMSASLGNIVYPNDWLEVATPQLLKFFYNKRLMKTRSFSWKDLGVLYDDYDAAARIYFGKDTMDNEREAEHLKRLYFVANNPKNIEPRIPMTFAHATFISQIFTEKKDIISSLKKTGHYDKGIEKELLERVRMARAWVDKYAPADQRFVLQDKLPDISLSPGQREAIRSVVKFIMAKNPNEQELFSYFYEVMKQHGLKPAEFFTPIYRILLNKERGPRLASFLLASGDRALRLLEKL